ncbi:ABC transporter substrate-binding protein [Nakamurella leprariae]|nr:ABC transporter substrate-binding protein [Nakamurella leprariae]
MKDDLTSLANAASTALTVKALNRRSLFRIGGSALALGGASAFLAACGGNPAGNRGGTSSGGSAAASGGAAGGTDTLTVSTSLGGTVFDPELPAGNFQFPMLYDSLFDTDTPPDSAEAQALLADFEPQPALATKWESNEDNSVWTITLNTEATSPYGNKLTSADILWTFERHLAMKWYGGIFLNRVGVTDISQIEAPTPDTFVMNLAGPVGRTYFLLVMGCFIVPIFDSVEGQQHVTAEDPWASDWISKNACGFGPYTLKSSSPDGALNVFEANPNYYGETPIQTVTFRQTTETSTQLQLLLRGEAQLIDSLSPIQVAEVENSDSAKITRVANTGYTFIGFNNSQDNYKEVALHQGMAYALPFGDIVDSVYKGLATPMQSVLPDFFQGATNEFWTYEQDLDRARELLAPFADAGLVLQYKAGDTVIQTLAVLIQSSLQAVGLPIELNAMDPASFQQQLTGATLSMWIDNQSTPLVPDSLYGLQLLFPSEPTQVLIHYSNPIVDEAVGALASSFDPQEQVELIRTAQEQIMKDLAVLPLAQTGGLVPTANNVTNIKGHGANLAWAKGLQYS